MWPTLRRVRRREGRRKGRKGILLARLLSLSVPLSFLPPLLQAQQCASPRVVVVVVVGKGGSRRRSRRRKWLREREQGGVRRLALAPFLFSCPPPLLPPSSPSSFPWAGPCLLGDGGRGEGGIEVRHATSAAAHDAAASCRVHVGQVALRPTTQPDSQHAGSEGWCDGGGVEGKRKRGREGGVVAPAELK